MNKRYKILNNQKQFVSKKLSNLYIIFLIFISDIIKFVENNYKNKCIKNHGKLNAFFLAPINHGVGGSYLEN